MNINMIGNRKWVKHWAGHWNVVNDTLLGYQYTKLFEKDFGFDLKYALFIYREGYTSAYLDRDEMEIFGNKLVQEIKSNLSIVDTWCQDLKGATDNILDFVKNNITNDIDKETYNKFVELFYKYGVPHRAVKIVVDYLEADLLKNLLPKLSDARIYSEPVYKETENFIKSLTKSISIKENYSYEEVLALTNTEIDNYFKNGKLPGRKILLSRYKSNLIYFEDGDYDLLVGYEVEKAEKIISSSYEAEMEIKGTTAYSGKVVGKVKIVMDPDKIKEFNQGDILVTGMTRPEYINLIKKAGAFVTDAGGMLSHAAITARELKKPCIVGTEVGTKILKDDDVIEVDADKGIIKKINEKA